MLCKYLINIFAKLCLSKLVFLDGKLIISGPVKDSILNLKKANKKHDFMEHDRIKQNTYNKQILKTGKR